MAHYHDDYATLHQGNMSRWNLLVNKVHNITGIRRDVLSLLIAVLTIASTDSPAVASLKVSVLLKRIQKDPSLAPGPLAPATTTAATTTVAPAAIATAATAATATAAIAGAPAATTATACCATMASLRVLAFDHEGRPIQFDTWLDDLQLYLLSDSKDSVSLFDLASGAATAPPATADSATHSQWLTRDAAARLAIRNHLPLAECAYFGQHKTAQALYACCCCSRPTTTALLDSTVTTDG
ncbi:unnamed protein product [Closterium sp. NIES-54]